MKTDKLEDGIVKSFADTDENRQLFSAHMVNCGEKLSRLFSIEGYYNRVRRHSAIGYKTPIKYEAEFYEKEKSLDWIETQIKNSPEAKSKLI